jgi:hypothetical protein
MTNVNLVATQAIVTEGDLCIVKIEDRLNPLPEPQRGYKSVVVYINPWNNVANRAKTDQELVDDAVNQAKNKFGNMYIQNAIRDIFENGEVELYNGEL